MEHIPVLRHEAIDGLNLRAGKTYVDGTFGRGGYTKEILKRCPDCRLVALDQDPTAEEAARNLQKQGCKFDFIRTKFSQMRDALNTLGISNVDGIVLDIGISSPQVDKPERGFSFQQDGPLDMRMSMEGQTAADVVNSLSIEELARIIREYGDEKRSYYVAKAIEEARKIKPIETTTELAKIVRSEVRRDFASNIDGATRTFQALRIYVNNELSELEKVLVEGKSLLNPGGRFAVVSFHSLEDRIVKSFFKRLVGEDQVSSRHLPFDIFEEKAEFKFVKKGSIKPTEEEIKNNPRARSARLRVVEKI